VALVLVSIDKVVLELFEASSATEKASRLVQENVGLLAVADVVGPSDKVGRTPSRLLK